MAHQGKEKKTGWRSPGNTAKNFSIKGNDWLFLFAISVYRHPKRQYTKASTVQRAASARSTL
jgi:hypothetical protein